MTDTHADTMTETKPKATGTIRAEVGKVAGQAADKARAYAGDGKDKATGMLDELAKMMTDAAGTVDERLGEQYGKYARTAADSVSGFADKVRGKEVDDIVADARDLVRKSPVVAIGAAAAIGFVLARLLKAGTGSDDKPDA